MSCSAKVCVLLLSISLTPAIAQQITFDNSRGKAEIETQLFNHRRGPVSDVRIEFNLPAINVDQGQDGFDSVSASGLTPTIQAGNPELATTGSLIAVPKGFTATLEIESADTREIDNVLIKPSQKRWRCENNNADEFHFNSALYESKGLYPATVTQLEDMGDFQGVHLVRIAVRPLQSDFQRRKLLVTTHLVAKIHLEVSGRTETIRLEKTPFQVIRSLTANGMGLGDTVVQANSPETFVIITPESLKNAIQPLVNWKQQRGLNVRVLSMANQGLTNVKVKEELMKFYQEASVKPTYFLFVGNKTSMPPFMEETEVGPAASDWKYSLLSGGSDRIPDVFYGRLVADSEAEVTTQVNRSIAFEKSPERLPWYHDGTTIASNEGSAPSDKEYAAEIQEALKAYTYKSVDNFLQGEQTATTANITKALSDGRSWISYFGHGSGTSWGSVNGTFNNKTVDALSNPRLPVIIDVACLNASWVDIGKPFGKAWMTGEKEGVASGAVAFYGGSVSISWDPPAVMSVGIAKSHFQKKLSTLGASVTAGQLYLFEKMGMGEETLDNIKWYNLMGDPSLTLRTDEPVQYNVKYTVQPQQGTTKVKVVANRLQENKGVEGLVVSVANANRSMLGVAKTDAAGEATVELPTIGGLETSTLTVTGYNADTYQTMLK